MVAFHLIELINSLIICQVSKLQTFNYHQKVDNELDQVTL